MLIEDQKGNQLLELIALTEAQLSKVAPLTHALVVVRRNGHQNLLVFNRQRQYLKHQPFDSFMLIQMPWWSIGYAVLVVLVKAFA